MFDEDRQVRSANSLRLFRVHTSEQKQKHLSLRQVQMAVQKRSVQGCFFLAITALRLVQRNPFNLTSSIFTPHHLVNHAHIALDDLDHLGGHILHIVGHGNADVAIVVHGHGGFHRLLHAAGGDTRQNEAALVQRLGALGGSADAHRREGLADAGEEAGFLGQGAGVAHHAVGVHLQVVVIVEAQRLVQPHPLVQLEAHGLQPLAAAGMAGVEDGHVVFFRQRVDGGEQGHEVFLGVDVLLPVGTEQHVLFGLQTQTLQYIGGLDLLEIGTQDLGHGAAGHIGALFRGALGVQVTAGMLGVAQVHVRDVIHDATVGLLRQALVKAPVARFHVEDGNVQPLGGNGGQAAVGVAQNQQSVRLQLHHQLVALGDDVADGLAQILAHRVQVVVWRPQAQILKEDAVQGVVVVLAGVHQNLVEVFVAFFNHGGKADNLRPGAHDGHQFQFAHSSLFPFQRIASIFHNHPRFNLGILRNLIFCLYRRIQTDMYPFFNHTIMIYHGIAIDN